MKVIVTVDTEADDAWSPAPSGKVTVENLRFVPRFQTLCERYGFKPTYLCTYEVVRSQLFQDTVRGYEKRGQAEIGAHLHPWTNPPFKAGADVVDFDKSEYPGYPSELSADAFHAKMKVLTDAIVERAGVVPRSYRAGRWGFSTTQIPVLLELGYTVDCSVTPLVDRSTYKGVAAFGPDFRAAPVAPYELAKDDICAPGDSGLYEVPVTVVHTHALMRQSETFRRLFRRFRRSLPARAMNKTMDLEPIWFRPYPDMTPRRMRKVHATAERLGLPALEMMLHSSELMPGCSESYPTEASIEKMYERLEGTFRDLHAAGCEGVTLTAFADAHRPKPRKAAA